MSPPLFVRSARSPLLLIFILIFSLADILFITHLSSIIYCDFILHFILMFVYNCLFIDFHLVFIHIYTPKYRGGGGMWIVRYPLPPSSRGYPPSDVAPCV